MISIRTASQLSTQIHRIERRELGYTRTFSFHSRSKDSEYGSRIFISTATIITRPQKALTQRLAPFSGILLLLRRHLYDIPLKKKTSRQFARHDHDWTQQHRHRHRHQQRQRHQKQVGRNEKTTTVVLCSRRTRVLMVQSACEKKTYHQ